jgi:hypothetical protein
MFKGMLLGAKQFTKCGRALGRDDWHFFVVNPTLSEHRFMDIKNAANYSFADTTGWTS